MKQMILVATLILGMYAVHAQQSTVRQRHPITKINVALVTGLILMLAPRVQGEQSELFSAYQACREKCAIPYRNEISYIFGILPASECVKQEPDYCIKTHVLPSIVSLEKRLEKLEKERSLWW